MISHTPLGRAACITRIERVYSHDVIETFAAWPTDFLRAIASCFIFARQGKSAHGIARALFHSSTVLVAYMARVDCACRDVGIAGVNPFLRGDTMTDSEDPRQEQLALVCLELGLFHLWARWGVRPDVVVGHSLGKYAALHVAGVLSLADMI